MKILEFFQEANGQLSSLRLYSFMAICTAIVLTFTGGSYEVILSWMVAGFVPKAFGKLAEGKLK